VNRILEIRIYIKHILEEGNGLAENILLKYATGCMKRWITQIWIAGRCEEWFTGTENENVRTETNVNLL
jgi:hypothetical protein